MSQKINFKQIAGWIKAHNDIEEDDWSLVYYLQLMNADDVYVPKDKVQKLVEAVKAAEIMFDKFTEEMAIKHKEPGILLRQNPFTEVIKEFEAENGGKG